jgi:TPR repeat protein
MKLIKLKSHCQKLDMILVLRMVYGVKTPKTLAIKSFQAKTGLPVTGYLDDKTKRALGFLPADMKNLGTADIRKAAEQGYAPAQYNLGIAYESGKGVIKNEQKAVK